MTAVDAPHGLRSDSDKADTLDTDPFGTMASLPLGHPSHAALRDHAVRVWLPLARRLALRFAGKGEPLDDLVQTATVGLINAVDRFDPARGVPFIGFAIPTIVGELKRHFRDRTWSMRVPRRLQEHALELNAAAERLTHGLGRAPTVADLAADVGLDEETVLEALEANRAYRARSLSEPATHAGDLELGDTLGAPDHDLELAELHLALGPVLAVLSDRERQILHLRFHGDQTQSQIAARIGVSQMHISRIITRALAKLRVQLETS